MEGLELVRHFTEDKVIAQPKPKSFGDYTVSLLILIISPPYLRFHLCSL